MNLKNEYFLIFEIGGSSLQGDFPQSTDLRSFLMYFFYKQFISHRKHILISIHLRVLFPIDMTHAAARVDGLVITTTTSLNHEFITIQQHNITIQQLEHNSQYTHLYVP